MKLLELYHSKGRPLILDGAIGGFLQQEGVILPGGLWSTAANISAPQKVTDLHKSYVDAGAEIITTNTFRTNPHFAKPRFQVDQLCKEAVKLARNAVEDKSILIAGSNAPAEDCYQAERTITKEQLKANHHEHIDALIEGGVDLIWNETFSHSDEIEIVCDYCHKNDYEFTINLFTGNSLRLLSGEPLEPILEMISEYSPAVVGFNCIYDQTFSNIDLKMLIDNFGFYLNCGAGSFKDQNIRTGISPENYALTILPYLEYNPIYIGSCCGSSPKHTQQLRDTLVEIYND
jgi:methionine synthase I (cobalamin-dependent)